MKKLNIYLDTSVISFLYADDVPDLRGVTEAFFDGYVQPVKYLVHISDVVIREILKTRNPTKRALLLGVTRQFPMRILSPTEETDRLAEVYVHEGVVPHSK